VGVRVEVEIYSGVPADVLQLLLPRLGVDQDKPFNHSRSFKVRSVALPYLEEDFLSRFMGVELISDAGAALLLFWPAGPLLSFFFEGWVGVGLTSASGAAFSTLPSLPFC
jgi:hypothetical protein